MLGVIQYSGLIRRIKRRSAFCGPVFMPLFKLECCCFAVKKRVAMEDWRVNARNQMKFKIAGSGAKCFKEVPSSGRKPESWYWNCAN
jgi:hypothetical protein